ncbi:hypothetical protein MRY16398_07030 [Phytobacter sp. MRY16-398]|jgi:hypothetical protein|nr:hypothetical protein MRY16398_07030 [Phytobacter sp. MRY16-398]
MAPLGSAVGFREIFNSYHDVNIASSRVLYNANPMKSIIIALKAKYPKLTPSVKYPATTDSRLSSIA